MTSCAISEAELHMLTARLVGGMRNKARRGALQIPLPIGLVYNATGTVVLDPDSKVQASVRQLFETFRRTRSAKAVEDHFRREGLEFPRRLRRGIARRRLIFGPLRMTQILHILHNPRYAGAYVYGRRRRARQPGSPLKTLPVPRSDWQVLIKDAHPAYIAWEEFESNEQILQDNIQAFLRGRPAGGISRPEALLQGRVLCGVCGTRMQVRDEQRNGQLIRYYVCQDASTGRRYPSCRWVAAPEIEAAIATLVLQMLTGAHIQSALAVQDEITRQLEQAQALRRRQLEQARHGAELKRRRFLHCDPDRRLVADALEADWNEALRRLDALQQDHEHQRQADPVRLDQQSRTRLASLAQDFRRAWNDPDTTPHERHGMVGLLIEDVTLVRGDPIMAHVRFRGGRITTLSVARPVPTARASKVLPEVIRELDRLLESCLDAEAATRLNALGYRSWAGEPFNGKRVESLRLRAGIMTCFERLRAQGFLTAYEMARDLKLCVTHTQRLAHAGVLPIQHYGKGQRFLFAPLHGATFVRGHGGPSYVTRPPRLLPAPKSKLKSPMHRGDPC